MSRIGNILRFSLVKFFKKKKKLVCRYVMELINSVPKLGSMKGVKQPKKFENIDLG